MDEKNLAEELALLRHSVTEKASAETLDRKELLAKLENLDRSVQENTLTAQQAELARKREWDMVRELLGEERNDRRGELVQKRAAVEKRSALVVQGIKSIWDKGGQWIIAAICLIAVLKLQSCAGFHLLDILQVVK
jgi:hypothetical protein